MDINSAYPSKFLKASDLNDRAVAVTMERVEIEKMQDGKTKPVVYFLGKTKGLVLNKTNANRIMGMYGADTDDWQGGQIEIFPADVEFQGNMVQAIRVRAVNKNRPAQRAPAQQASGEGQATTQRMATHGYSEANPPPHPGTQLDGDEIPW